VNTVQVRQIAPLDVVSGMMKIQTDDDLTQIQQPIEIDP
jgi:hypothetical protein